MNVLRLCVEAVSWALNRFFYRFFNTVWSVVYFFTFWRNIAFVVLVAAAFVIDWVRRDAELCKRITLKILSVRAVAILVALSGLALFSLVVVSIDAKPISFATPYQHYEHALQYADLLRARVVYVLESTGIGFAALLLAFLSVRQSAALVQLNRLPNPAKPSRFRELWPALTFLMVASVVGLLSVTGGVSKPSAIFRPASDVVALIMYTLAPGVMAVVMKYWLMMGFVLTTEEASSES